MITWKSIYIVGGKLLRLHLCFVNYLLSTEIRFNIKILAGPNSRMQGTMFFIGDWNSNIMQQLF
jgi:hypothetical protein